MNWWNRLLVWLGISKPGRRKEQVENWIETNASTIASIRAEQGVSRSARGWFRQLRRQDRYLSTLPAGTEFQIDTYEAPVEHKTKSTRFGYTMTFTVTEVDKSVWTLTLEPGAEKAPEWVEVPRVGVL